MRKKERIQTVKKICATILTMLMLFAIIPTTAYATESSQNEAAFQCNVSFLIIDETANGYPGSEIKAVFTNDQRETVGVEEMYRNIP